MKGISSVGSGDKRLDDEDDEFLYDSVCDFAAADTVSGRLFGVEDGFTGVSEMITIVASVGDSRSMCLSASGDHAILQLSNVASSSKSLSSLREDNASRKEAVDGGERVLSRELEGEEKDSKLPFLIFKFARIVTAVVVVLFILIVVVINFGGNFGVIVVGDGRESRS